MISFWVDGRCAPQGSKVFKGFRGGKPILVDQCKFLPAWKSAVKLAAQKTMINGGHKMFEKRVVILGFRFFMTRPKSHYKKDGTLKPTAPIYCLSSPDLTKIVRSSEDAMSLVVYGDDCLVSRQYNEKYYQQPEWPPGVLVEVMAIDQMQWGDWVEPPEWSEP